MTNTSYAVTYASGWASTKDKHYDVPLIQWFRNSGSTQNYLMTFTPTLGDRTPVRTNTGYPSNHITNKTSPFWPLPGKLDNGFNVKKELTVEEREFTVLIQGGVGHWMPCPIVKSLSYYWSNETYMNSNFVPRNAGLKLKNYKTDQEHLWSLGLSQTHTPYITGQVYAHNNTSKFDVVRNLGPDWYVYGIWWNFRSNAHPAAAQAPIGRLVDVRLGHEVGGLKGTNRIILPKAMSWSNFTSALKSGQVKYDPMY